MSRPSHCPWFYHVNNILWGIPTTKIFISSSLHHFPITSSLLGKTIFLSVPFSSTLSLYSSVNATDQVSHPLKKGAKLQSIRNKRKINETVNFTKCQHLQLEIAACQRCASLVYRHSKPTVQSKPDRKLRLSSNPGWRTLSNGPFSVLMEIPCHACMESDRAASQEPLCHPDVVLLYTAPSLGEQRTHYGPDSVKTWHWSTRKPSKVQHTIVLIIIIYVRHVSIQTHSQEGITYMHT